MDDAPSGDFGDFGDAGNSDNKPFDDKPFDAGVEADENSDPKTFIEQLTGKLGQSLRKYTETQGQPDFELEKFAINSLLSATHTSEMKPEDQEDIIKKIKEAGKGDEPDTDTDPNNDDANQDVGGFSGGAADSVGASDGASGAGDGGGAAPSVSESESLFLAKPKKNNMFQPNSNDILEINDEKSLEISENLRIFDKIKSRLRETFNQEDTMTEPMVEPQVMPKPETKPAPSRVQPQISPSRRNKPFLPMPDVKPDPKAIKENGFDFANAERDYHDSKAHNDFNQYVDGIKTELTRLGGCEKIIKIIDGDFSGDLAKYQNSSWANLKTKYFKDNFERGFPPEITAAFTRDSWYKS